MNIGLNYSFANNTIQYVSNNGANGVTTVTYENIGENKNLGINFNTNFTVKKRNSFNFNTQFSYVWTKGAANGKLYSNDGILASVFAGYNYKFEKNWRTSLNLNYYGPAITLQGKTSPYYYSSLSLSKDFYKKKMNITVSASNPFKSRMNYLNQTNSLEFSQNRIDHIVYRRFNVGYNYRFGKLKLSIKKNKRGINNDDVKHDDVSPD